LLFDHSPGSLAFTTLVVHMGRCTHICTSVLLHWWLSSRRAKIVFHFSLYLQYSIVWLFQDNLVMMYKDQLQHAMRPKRVRQIQDHTGYNLSGNLLIEVWSWVAARPVGSSQFASEEGCICGLEQKWLHPGLS
jgi:hypothetical protein